MADYSFNTSRGEIEIEVDSDMGFVRAYCDDEEIGVFSYEIHEGYEDSYTSEPDVYELINMHVNSEYQKLGIGTQMIKTGEEFFECVTYPQFGASRHGNHLSNEGFQLLQSCIRKNIIPYEKVFGYSDEEDTE